MRRLTTRTGARVKHRKPTCVLSTGDTLKVKDYSPGGWLTSSEGSYDQRSCDGFGGLGHSGLKSESEPTVSRVEPKRVASRVEPKWGAEDPWPCG